MGHRIYARDLFDEVIYNKKTTAELQTAMTAKTIALLESLTRREERLAGIRDEYDIGPERLAELIIRFSNEGNSRSTSYDNQGSDAPIVPAGVIANIVRERDMLDTERDQMRKMELILRNIKDTEPYIHEETGEVRRSEGVV